MNKEIVLLELNEAHDHIQDLIKKIKVNQSKNPYELEFVIKDVIRHLSRAYNYRNAKNEEYLAPPLLKMMKMAQPPPELIPHWDETNAQRDIGSSVPESHR